MAKHKQGLIKTAADIVAIKEGGQILHRILQDLGKQALPGVSTWQLNAWAEKAIVAAGGRPAFKNYGGDENPFPAGLCTSINSVVVHGIPSKSDLLQEGDIISLDIGMEYKNLYTDTAITVGVGRIKKEIQKLLDVTRESLQLGIKAARVGNTTGDIGHAIQSCVEAVGFNVIRDLVGHGVGYEVHEAPYVPCFGQPHSGVLLEENMVLAIEPMVVTGSYKLNLADDGWTISTRDQGLSAHFEHTVAVLKNGAEILT